MVRRRGLSLIELMMVLWVVAVLSLLVARSFSAVDKVRVVEADAIAMRVVEAEHAYASSNGGFTGDPALLNAGRDVKVVSTAASAPGEVSIWVSEDGRLGVAGLGATGCVLYAVDPPWSGGAPRRVAVLRPGDPEACSGATALSY